MSPTALRRAVGLSALLIGLSILLGYVHAGGTFAILTGEVTNKDSALAAGWVGPPTGLGTPAPSGYGASLAWTPGTHGPVTGQQLYGVDGGAGASANCGTYALAATMASATTASYSTTGASGASGHWWCYRLVSTSATAWTAAADFTPIRVGLIPSTVALTNGGTAGAVDSGDTITITFNQDVNTASATNVCLVSGASGAGVILIGDTTCAGASDSYTIGKLTGLTISSTGTASRTATVATSGNQVTVTVTSSGTRTVSGTATFTASTGITSSTGSAAACTASNCLVTASGGF
ncbi:MAG TPA: hypothetical protein VJ986_08575 [Gaiellaceae bacterium]|nr:hypothetical protein [Gaiellaceae bacterium]